MVNIAVRHGQLRALNDGLARAASIDEARANIQAAMGELGDDRQCLARCLRFLVALDVPIEADTTERELYLGFARKLVELRKLSNEQLAHVEAQTIRGSGLRRAQPDPTEELAEPPAAKIS